GKAAEFDRGLLAADRVHLGARVGDDQGLVPIEVGELDAVLVLAEVIGELLTDPVLPLGVRDVGEWARAHDVLLVPVDVRLELRRAVDEVPWRREVRGERRGRVLELEGDRVGRSGCDAVRVEFVERAVVRRDRMQEREGRFAVPVERRRLGVHDEGQRSARLRLLRGGPGLRWRVALWCRGASRKQESERYWKRGDLAVKH